MTAFFQFFKKSFCGLLLIYCLFTWNNFPAMNTQKLCILAEKHSFEYDLNIPSCYNWCAAGSGDKIGKALSFFV